ncbi:hypothetical protein PMAYCL1PPCAC_19009, partial [Pristionchus mayeri]
FKYHSKHHVHITVVMAYPRYSQAVPAALHLKVSVTVPPEGTEIAPPFNCIVVPPTKFVHVMGRSRHPFTRTGGGSETVVAVGGITLDVSKLPAHVRHVDGIVGGLLGLVGTQGKIGWRNDKRRRRRIIMRKK